MEHKNRTTEHVYVTGTVNNLSVLWRKSSSWEYVRTRKMKRKTTIWRL